MEALMSISGILGFLALIGLIMAVAGAGLAISGVSQGKSSRPGIGLAIVGTLIAIVFFIASSGLIQVGPTQVAVVYQSVGGDPTTNSLWATPLRPGVHIIPPIITEVFYYSTEARNYTMSRTSSEGQVRGDDAIAARTRDGQQVFVDVSVQYNIDPAQANQLHILWQNRYENDFVRPTVRSVVREIVANYSVNDLYTGSGGTVNKLTEVSTNIESTLKEKFTENGLNMRQFLLRETTFSEEFINAVEQRQVAEQQAEQAKQEALRRETIAKGEAAAAIAEAEGAATAAIARAKGEAESIRLRAAAEAEALNLINEQLSKNPMLIQWRYIENLADNVRLVLVPSNSPFLFDIQSLLAQQGSEPVNDTQSTPNIP
jgi:regulator of protease activity HflC (stomatin/prohibitin superfamily)